MGEDDNLPPSQTESLPSLRRFSIPKQAKSKDLLTQCSCESRDGREIIRNIQNSLWDSSLINIKYERIDIVTNEKLELEYVKKRKEMKQQQYTSSETADTFAYLFLQNMNDCVHLCKNGLHVGEQKHLPSKASLNIGHKLYGTYVFRSADAVTRRKLYEHKSDSFLLVLKIIKGRLKQVSCNPDLEPTPEFDGHVSKEFQLGKKISQADICNASLLYLYEVNLDNFDPSDDSAVYTKRPRQCIPYAVVKFQATQKVITPSTSISNRPVVHANISKDTHATSSIQQRTPELFEEFVYERYFIKSTDCWNGYLLKSGLVYSEICLRVFSQPMILPVVGLNLCISQKISLEKLQKIFPPKIFRRLPCESFTAQVNVNGFLFTHAEIHPPKTPTVQTSARTLTKLNEHLRKSNIAGFCNLPCGIKLYVIPTCDFTDKLGITNQEYPPILHCVFMQRNTDTQKTYTYAFDEYEAFIKHQKASFKIKLLNQETLKQPKHPMDSSSKFSFSTAEQKQILDCFQAITIALDKRRNNTKQVKPYHTSTALNQRHQNNLDESNVMKPTAISSAETPNLPTVHISNPDDDTMATDAMPRVTTEDHIHPQLCSGEKTVPSSSGVKPLKKYLDVPGIERDSNSDSLVIDTAREQSQDENLYSDVSDVSEILTPLNASKLPTSFKFFSTSNEPAKNVVTCSISSTDISSTVVFTPTATLHDLTVTSVEEIRKDYTRQVHVANINDKSENFFQDISSSSDIDDMQRKLQGNRKMRRKQPPDLPKAYLMSRPDNDHGDERGRSSTTGSCYKDKYGYEHYGKPRSRSRHRSRRSRSRSISPRRRRRHSSDRERSSSPPLFQPTNSFSHLNNSETTKVRRKEECYPVRAKNSITPRSKKNHRTCPASQGNGSTNIGYENISGSPIDATDTEVSEGETYKIIDTLPTSPSCSEDEKKGMLTSQHERKDRKEKTRISDGISTEMTQGIPDDLKTSRHDGRKESDQNEKCSATVSLERSSSETVRRTDLSSAIPPVPLIIATNPMQPVFDASVTYAPANPLLHSRPFTMISFPAVRSTFSPNAHISNSMHPLFSTQTAATPDNDLPQIAAAPGNALPQIAAAPGNDLPHSNQFPLLSFPRSIPPPIPIHQMPVVNLPYDMQFLHGAKNVQNCLQPNQPNIHPVVSVAKQMPVPVRTTTTVATSMQIDLAIVSTSNDNLITPSITSTSMSNTSDQPFIVKFASTVMKPLHAVMTTTNSSPMTSTSCKTSLPTHPTFVTSIVSSPVEMVTAAASIVTPVLSSSNATSQLTNINFTSDVIKPYPSLSSQITKSEPQVTKVNDVIPSPTTVSPTCFRTVENIPTQTCRLEVTGHGCYASLEEWSRHLNHSHLDSFCEDLIKQVSLDLS